MNDRQLRAFVAVGQTGSMSRAAGQMYISVPALKKQMDTLEKELGVRLMIRTNQGVMLTPAGEAFQVLADRMTAELDAEIRKLREMEDNETMRIRIAYDNSYVLDKVFLYAVAAFREEMPDIQISTERAAYFDRGKYDLFFGANYAEAGDVTMHYLCELPITCVISRNHSLGKNVSLDIADLLDENMLFPPREMLAIGAPGLLETVGNEAEFIRLSEERGAYENRAIIESRIGIMIGFEEHVNENLVQLPLKGYKFRYRIYSVGADKKPCLRQFIEFLKDYYPKKCDEMCTQLGLNA